MKFLVIFLALLIIWKVPLNLRSSHSRSVERWLQLSRYLPRFDFYPKQLQFAWVVILPTLVFFFVFSASETLFWGLPNLAMEIVLVVYVLMHADVQRHIRNYEEKVAQQDYQAAYLCAKQHLDLTDADIQLNQAEEITPIIIKALLYRWFEYFFLVLFWYLIADVAGIVLVWLTLQYSKQSNNSISAQVLHLLEAIPVRLLALTYGLAGNLVQALPVWQKYLWQWRTEHSELLFSVAQSSLPNVEPGVGIPPEWHRMHRYSISIWLVIIAIATLGGWVL